MTRSALKYRFCYPQIDRHHVVDFLGTQKAELYLQDESAVHQVADLVFENGGVFAGFDPAKRLQSMLGFFFGDPADEFSDKQLAFLYVAAISPNFRLTRAFHVGLKQVLGQFQEMGLESIRMQAKTTDKYANKLYGRFARPIGEGFSLRGQPVITYGGSIEEALAYFEPKKREPSISEFRHVPITLSARNAKHEAGLMPVQL